MQRVILLTVMVGFSGLILVFVQEPFRSHSTPYSMGLELTVSAVGRIFGALIAVVTTIELLLRISSGRQVPNISHWVVILLSALCLFTSTWHAPLGLAIVAGTMIVASGFGRGSNPSASESDVATESSLENSSADFNQWDKS